MDIHIYIYIILILIISILGYTTWNILRKYERNTDGLLEAEDRIFEIKQKVNNTYKQMKELDQKEIFSTDDEVGQAFKQIKELVDELDRGV